MSLSQTIELINDYARELTLFTCFGLDRNRYDFYHPELGYYTMLHPEQYDTTNPSHFLIHQPYAFPDPQRLIEARGQLYLPVGVETNISTNPSFLDFLVCYDFTSAVRQALTFARGPGQPLISSQPKSGYQYSYTSPVTDRLSTRLNRNGIYLCEIKFQSEDHAFILVLQDQTLTVLHRYNTFITKEFDLAEGLGKILLLERNVGDNKPLLDELFGAQLYFNQSDYMILSLERCEYWDAGFNAHDLAEFFAEISRRVFEGREEARELQELVDELNTKPM